MLSLPSIFPFISNHLLYASGNGEDVLLDHARPTLNTPGTTTINITTISLHQQRPALTRITTSTLSTTHNDRPVLNHHVSSQNDLPDYPSQISGIQTPAGSVASGLQPRSDQGDRTGFQSVLKPARRLSDPQDSCANTATGVAIRSNIASVVLKDKNQSKVKNNKNKNDQNYNNNNNNHHNVYPSQSALDMRFTCPDARPLLTPLGHRLLYISEAKLTSLESPMGGREDAAALRKSVVMREAVRLAWRSVDQGAVGDLTDWHSKGAMGLDVIGEEEAEDEEGTVSGRGEEKWFEDLLGTFGDDEYAGGMDDAQEHEWAESSVAPVYDDIEYDDEDMEAFTFPTSPTLSPRSSPPSLAVSSPVPCSATVTPAYRAPLAAVDVVEVVNNGCDEHAHDDECPVCSDSEVCSTCPTTQPPQPILVPLSAPLTPLPTPAGSPASTIDSVCSDDMDDLDECADDFLLPPPLHRSTSSTSTTSSTWTDPDDECVCVTPPSESCEVLEKDATTTTDRDMMTRRLDTGYQVTKTALQDAWLDLEIEWRLGV